MYTHSCQLGHIQVFPSAISPANASQLLILCPNNIARLLCYCTLTYIAYHLHFQETHLLHEFPDDFYGSELYVCICGYVRQEMKFDSLGRNTVHVLIEAKIKIMYSPQMN